MLLAALRGRPVMWGWRGGAGIYSPVAAQPAKHLHGRSASAGPAIAGACVVTVGPRWAIIIDAATFFVNVAMLLRIKFTHVPCTVDP